MICKLTNWRQVHPAITIVTGAGMAAYLAHTIATPLFGGYETAQPIVRSVNWRAWISGISLLWVATGAGCEIVRRQAAS